MFEQHFCTVKGCGRPSNDNHDQPFGNAILRLWLCEQHTDGARKNELELDLSRANWVIKASTVETVGNRN